MDITAENTPPLSNNDNVHQLNQINDNSVSSYGTEFYQTDEKPSTNDSYPDYGQHVFDIPLPCDSEENIQSTTEPNMSMDVSVSDEVSEYQHHELELEKIEQISQSETANTDNIVTSSSYVDEAHVDHTFVDSVEYGEANYVVEEMAEKSATDENLNVSNEMSDGSLQNPVYVEANSSFDDDVNVHFVQSSCTQEIPECPSAVPDNLELISENVENADSSTNDLTFSEYDTSLQDSTDDVPQAKSEETNHKEELADSQECLESALTQSTSEETITDAPKIEETAENTIKLNSTDEESINQNSIEEISLDEVEQQFVLNDGAIVLDESEIVDDPEPLERLTNESLEEKSDEAPKEKEQAQKPVKKRGRKHTGEIPLHIIGHSITKPAEDIMSNGKPVLKPRLGVKIPYRNLTSQIISRQDLQKEIVDRARQKQAETEKTQSVQTFARKLTQRLVNKISLLDEGATGSSDKESTKKKRKSLSEDEPVLVTVEQDILLAEVKDGASKIKKLPLKSVRNNETSNIESDSDLIAILEGDDDHEVVLPRPKPSGKPSPDISIKDVEKEVQQKTDTPKNKFFKSRMNKQLDGEESKKNLIKPSVVSPSSGLLLSKAKSQVDSKPIVKVPVEVEPTLKANMVLKTYTRKRKSTDAFSPDSSKKQIISIPVEPSPTPTPTPVKIDIATPESSAYVTKSSRVIKKKVIWDPDEVSPARSTPKSTAKIDLPKPTPSKIEKKIEKKLVTEKKEKSVEKSKENKSEKPELKSPINIQEKKPVEVDKIVDKRFKKVSKSPQKSPLKNKRLTEIDKLLMDEGAVNMLYDVKNAEQQQQKKRLPSTISLDRAQKDLMSRTKEVKNELQLNSGVDTSKSLRKKDAPPPVLRKEIPAPISRKMSKDSTRSSVHSPPASPAFSHGEASRIIRRHSSSSFSSDDDDPLAASASSEKSPRKRTADSKLAAESPKKKVKKDVVEKTPKTSAKESPKVTKSAEVEDDDTTDKVNSDKAFILSTEKYMAKIDLKYNGSNCHLTIQMLKDLISTLKDLTKSDCKVVLITSSAAAFCWGLDYKGLLEPNESLRKKRATELSTCVRDFLKCLLNFPKVLVAGIQGHCVGLGVLILPLFDIVVASDLATFSTPYAKLGCCPEAGFLLTGPYVPNQGLINELLLTSQTIKADDALRRGLITKLCWPEKYDSELKTLISGIASQSNQGLDAIKKHIRHHNIQVTETILTAQQKSLVELWTSAECQKNFADFVVSPPKK